MLENMEKTEKNRKNRRKINAMKATGIVRRIDDLGRVVVPKAVSYTHLDVYKRQDQNNGQYCENNGIDDFFHVKYNNFCFGTHSETSW